jgi:Tfp pilus assembly protein PilZ
MENRRSARRKPLVSSLEIFSKDCTKNLGKGYVTNLHEDGLCLVTDQHLEVGEEFRLNFGLPNGWKFDFFGRIVHAQEGIESKAYGVKFSPGQGTFIFKLV